MRSNVPSRRPSAELMAKRRKFLRLGFGIIHENARKCPVLGHGVIHARVAHHGYVDEP
jgi:hypothetical protein